MRRQSKPPPATHDITELLATRLDAEIAKSKELATKVAEKEAFLVALNEQVAKEDIEFETEVELYEGRVAKLEKAVQDMHALLQRRKADAVSITQEAVGIEEGMAKLSMRSAAAFILSKGRSDPLLDEAACEEIFTFRENVRKELRVASDARTTDLLGVIMPEGSFGSQRFGIFATAPSSSAYVVTNPNAPRQRRRSSIKIDAMDTEEITRLAEPGSHFAMQLVSDYVVALSTGWEDPVAREEQLQAQADSVARAHYTRLCDFLVDDLHENLARGLSNAPHFESLDDHCDYPQCDV